MTLEVSEALDLQIKSLTRITGHCHIDALVKPQNAHMCLHHFYSVFTMSQFLDFFFQKKLNHLLDHDTLQNVCTQAGSTKQPWKHGLMLQIRLVLYLL